MKTFKDLKFKLHLHGKGSQAKIHFDNNYNVNVIKFSGSHGFLQNLWKIAILYKDAITYKTYTTNDVLVHQTD